MEKRNTAGQLLAVLKFPERVEETTPYLKQLVRPGMRVVFLIRYPLEFRNYLRDHWVTTESARAAVLAGRKIMDRYSWEAQRGLAEQMVSPAHEALQKSGASVEVDLYAGSLRRLVLDYTAGRDVLLVLPPRSSNGSGRLIGRAFAPFMRCERARFYFYYVPSSQPFVPETPAVAVASSPPLKREVEEDWELKIARSQTDPIVHD